MGQLSDKEIGRKLGQIIVSLVDLIAEVDGISRDEVLEELFTGWWTGRITDTNG